MTAPAAPLYICTKCGRPSRTAKHDGCNYLATLCEETPAAPLDRAVETLRDDLKYVNASWVEVAAGSDAADVIRSAEALLAALDADKRLEEAEARLQAILDYEPQEVCKDEFAYDRMVEAYREAARCYFARREGAAVRGEEEGKG